MGLTDSNGTLVSTYQYDPYGNLTSSTGSVANPWRFAGGYFDSSTGLYKYGTRYYNPGFGRWSQQDPLRGQLNDPTSLNRYLYAGDDPVNVTDPSGRYQGLFGCVWDAIMAVVGLIAGLYAFVMWFYGLLVAANTVTVIGLAAELAFALPSFGEVLATVLLALGLIAAAYVLAEVISKCVFHEGEGEG